jgi:hypothetical protein
MIYQEQEKAISTVQYFLNLKLAYFLIISVSIRFAVKTYPEILNEFEIRNLSNSYNLSNLEDKEYFKSNYIQF